jgi:outer membrane protein OmpA-like peptidoglycan-associated protein
VVGLLRRGWVCASAIALIVVFALLNIPTSNAAGSNDALSQHQANRDALFNTLNASATKYTFKYVVIDLPAGAVPGKDFSIPVSHIRYESTVFFAFDQYVLQPDAEPIVQDLAKIIVQDTALRSILIVGHTDSAGPDSYNVTLSKNRAFTVATDLQKAGVTGKYIHIIPMGKEQPYATNSTVEGRRLNRRVEFFISDIPEATEKAVQLIRFNPCFRSDYSVDRSSTTAPCDDSLKRIPIFSLDSNTKPTGLLNLSAKPPERPRLPNNPLNRPSLQDLLDPNQPK